jgi:hypothetical protein
MSNTNPVRQVLELACSAERLNKLYVKETTPIYSDDGKIMSYTWANKMLVLLMLYPENYKKSHEDEPPPPLLRVIQEDRDLADEVQKYFRRLLFSAVQGDNEFQTKVNSILENGQVSASEIGFVACLPSVYKRDYARNKIKKQAKILDNTYLGEVGSNITDKDCEILESQRSKNFDAWNVCAIIENKMVSWMSKVDLKLGPAVVVKAKVKDHSKHWQHENAVTRLNYVKAVQ